MFDAKKETLGTVKSTTTSGNTKNVLANPFVSAGLKKSAMTTSTGNGALKFTTTGDPFVDQFGSVSLYKAPRKFSEIEADCEKLWAADKKKTVMFNFYIRLITRKVNLFNGQTTTESQRGGEMKHEGIMRMMWLHYKDQATFWKNIGLFVSIGSWQDVIKMLQYDLVYHGWENRVLNWDKFGKLILSGLSNENTCELLKKYLPQIKANSACKTVEAQADTIIGKWISSLLYGVKGENTGATYKAYRKQKSSGTAHSWQQLISQGKHNLVDFNSIHGRALMLMSRSKYLKNQGLEAKYEAWITKPETKDVKFTGFVPELFIDMPGSLTSLTNVRRDTINAQFRTLVTKGGEVGATKLIVARDTSGSMSSPAYGINMMSANVAKAMALYFSEFLPGRFKDSWIEFTNTSVMKQWVGNSPVEKWFNDSSSVNGGTNFLSVLDLFVSIKNQGVAESDFPTGILCISDNCFNPARDLGKTNVENALQILRRGGFSEQYVSNFIIALWNIPNKFYGAAPKPAFETFGDVKNVFYMSGYNGSIVSFLGGKVETASELVEAALSQEILQMIEI